MDSGQDTLLELLRSKFGEANATLLDNGHYAVRIDCNAPDRLARDEARELPLYQDLMGSGFIMGEPIGELNQFASASVMQADQPKLKLAKMVHMMMDKDGLDFRQMQTTREIVFEFNPAGEKRNELVKWFENFVPLPQQFINDAGSREAGM